MTKNKYFLEITSKKNKEFPKSEFGDGRGTKYFKSKKDAEVFKEQLKNDPEVGSDFRKDIFRVKKRDRN